MRSINDVILDLAGIDLSGGGGWTRNFDLETSFCNISFSKGGRNTRSSSFATYHFSVDIYACDVTIYGETSVKMAEQIIAELEEAKDGQEHIIIHYVMLALTESNRIIEFLDAIHNNSIEMGRQELRDDLKSLLRI